MESPKKEQECKNDAGSIEEQIEFRIGIIGRQIKEEEESWAQSHYQKCPTDKIMGGGKQVLPPSIGWQGARMSEKRGDDWR